MIQIVTDSASDITKKEAGELNIHIVPVNINFPDGICVQETEEDFIEFYKKLDSSEELPKTSHPSPALYLEIFEKAKENNDDVIIITLASGLSGTFNGARMAKDMCDYDRIYVVDSYQATAGQRILVEYAVKLKNQGVEAKKIAEELQNLRERITLNGMIDSLECLRKGGRIPAGLARLGSLLNIKPLIILKDNSLQEMGKARGKKMAVKMIYDVFEKNKPDVNFPVYFLYTSDKEVGADFMKETIEKYNLENFDTKLLPISGVLGTHIGKGIIGISYVIA